jgi:hypothetical protein
MVLDNIVEAEKACVIPWCTETGRRLRKLRTILRMIWVKNANPILKHIF